MDIVISPNAETPIYLQIYNEISAAILKGELAADYCLPSIRTIAKELRISVITVKKAYEELENRGFIYTAAGKGCFVAELSGAALCDKRDSIANEKLMKEIEYYKSLGLTREELLNLVDEVYKKV